MTKSITATVFMVLESEYERSTVRTRLRYRTDRPFEMTARFHRPGECAKSWVFARDLLLDGRGSFAGQGDLRIWPLRFARHSRVFFSLASDDGDCLLSADADDVDAWCAEMETLVPRGAEERHFDIDAQLARFLG
ncbi:SsgA family sporulation/cell division regulator [Streptomyces sp. NBC_00091]|uniref:SsgA family sporulation/cell division regulator n=1 Tax=Streptomyces sp. NBC_00091 TaxID=2975648 RepID=UPI002257DDD2|nr:SsgA family sporulation/cell division regulator [Streptomyces sp. NBC_00091]MCX5377372.1 SsgA family sporulation/cell division regulator [Streptomyces sp. NBC_00091]